MDIQSFDSLMLVKGIPLVFGYLRQASDFASEFSEAAKLTPTAPVFTGGLTNKRIKKLKGSSVFRVGAIPFDDCLVMTLRFQKGELLYVWLADASDSDFWSAIDRMRSTGEAGFSFSSEEQVWFSPYRTRDSASELEIYRQALGRAPNGFVLRAATLISSGALSFLTTSMLPGYEVKHAQACVLGTPQVESAAQALGATTLQW
ncbi:hypothetical protein A9R05_15640 [Burkholderia sp. KK1]|nr:hypothetical protein A9R05_15640 [Burkholderia sp. KK1]